MILLSQTLPIVTENLKERKLGIGLSDSGHKDTLPGEKRTCAAK